MYTILEKKSARGEHLFDAHSCAPRSTSGKTRTVHHRSHRRIRRTSTPDHLRLRRRARLGNDRHAGYRSLDPQALRPGAGRCAGRFRRSAGAPLGVHSRRSRHPAQETLPVCSGRRGYGSGLSAGKMASRTRGESGCHHRCQDQVDADLYRGDGPCSGQSLHRYRRRQRRLQRYGNGPDQRPDRQPGQAVRRLRGHRSDDYDEVRDAHDQGVLPADGRIAQYADGRWYGHVRRLPRHGGRQDRLHLCRWPPNSTGSRSISTKRCAVRVCTARRKSVPAPSSRSARTVTNAVSGSTNNYRSTHNRTFPADEYGAMLCVRMPKASTEQ